MKQLVIIGAGGIGRFVAEAVQMINAAAPTWLVLGFLDEDLARHGSSLDGFPVLGGPDWLDARSEVEALIAINHPPEKQRLVSQLATMGFSRFASVVHPTAWLARDVVVGAGCIIYPNVSLNRGVFLGGHVTINMNCAIGHDTSVGDYSSLAPGVCTAGGTSILHGSSLGIGSVTIQGVSIGPWAVVGANAAVIQDVPAHETVVGIPARPKGSGRSRC